MKQIEFYAGMHLDEAYQELQKNAPCEGEFNGQKLYSTDNLDDIYLKVLGKTKQESEEYERKQKEEYERIAAEFTVCTPQLIEIYRKRARGIIPEEHLEFWDKCVPIRLNDLYHGIELDSMLDLIEILNDENRCEDDRLKEGRDMFIKQGHSGVSAGLVFSGLRKFHPLGNDLVELINA